MDVMSEIVKKLPKEYAQNLKSCSMFPQPSYCDDFPLRLTSGWEPE